MSLIDDDIKKEKILLQLNNYTDEILILDRCSHGNID